MGRKVRSVDDLLRQRLRGDLADSPSATTFPSKSIAVRASAVTHGRDILAPITHGATVLSAVPEAASGVHL